MAKDWLLFKWAKKYFNEISFTMSVSIDLTNLPVICFVCFDKQISKLHSYSNIYNSKKKSSSIDGWFIYIQLTLVISNWMGRWKKFESTVVRLKRSYENTGSVVWNDERETTRAKFWRAKTSIACPYFRNDSKHIRCFCCCFFLSVKFFESCGTTGNF